MESFSENNFHCCAQNRLKGEERHAGSPREAWNNLGALVALRIFPYPELEIG